MYIDIDCHHGDRVEEVFYTSDRVMTCSLAIIFLGLGRKRNGLNRDTGWNLKYLGMEDQNTGMKDGSLDITRYANYLFYLAKCEHLVWQNDSTRAALASAPSVQMQDVPRESLSHHLGFRKDDGEERDELDKKLARTSYIL